MSWPKATKEENAVLGLQVLVSPVQDHYQKELGQELKEGTWKQELTMEKPGIGLLFLACSAFFF